MCERRQVALKCLKNLPGRPREDPAVERGIAEVGRQFAGRDTRERPRHHERNYTIENEGTGLDWGKLRHRSYAGEFSTIEPRPLHLIANSLSVPCVITTCAP